MQNRDALIATVAAFLKDRDDAFVMTDEQTDAERASSAEIVIDLLAPLLQGEPSTRAQAFEEAARYHDKEAVYYSTRNGTLDGVPFKLVAHFHRLHAASIRALSTPVADGCRSYVGEMKTSAGTDFFVMIKCGDRELSIRKQQWKHHADYEAAEYNWLFNGGEKPDILAFHPVSGGSSILPASPGASE